MLDWLQPRDAGDRVVWSSLLVIILAGSLLIGAGFLSGLVLLGDAGVLLDQVAFGFLVGYMVVRYWKYRRGC